MKPLNPDKPNCRSQRAHLVTIAGWLENRKCPGRRGIAERLEISTRTVSRIIDCLRDRMGAPVAYDRENDRYYLTETSWFLPQVSLTEGELFALLIARQSVAQYQGTPVEKTLETIFNKIAGELREHISIHADYSNRGVLSFAPSPVLPIRPEIWNTLLEATRSRKTVQIEYHSLRSGRKDQPVSAASPPQPSASWRALSPPTQPYKPFFHSSRTNTPKPANTLPKPSPPTAQMPNPPSLTCATSTKTPSKKTT